MKKPNEILKDMGSRLESILCELGRTKEVVFICKNEIVKETESLRRQIFDMEKSSEDDYHKALSKSALGTSVKLKALVEHLGLEYIPEGDVRQKAHFKEKKK